MSYRTRSEACRPNDDQGGRRAAPSRAAVRFEGMSSCSPQMHDLFARCRDVAAAGATVLVTGETGVGKELVARALHRRSGRPGRFVAANCASLPRELINSELFGHVRGAFTGAERARKGLAAHADRGTLFLDEIGDMPSETQQSLLRLLENRHIRPVGGQDELEVDVRIVAATHVDLERAVAAGAFRADLFFRLDVIRLVVPPLRSRPEDALLLFGQFIRRHCRAYGLEVPTFGDDFLMAVQCAPWPGNVRQLLNFCERLVLSRPQRALGADDFAHLRSGGAAVEAGDAMSPGLAASPHVDATKSWQENWQPLCQAYERTYYETLLRQCNGRVTAAARIAGVSRRTVLRKMQAYGLDKASFKESGASDR
ncbi:MAG: sigma-54-dependent Fis family transcriptional regulator [Planctomycetales bacterium]|nr:sigma-54-dependent Fis family transcriptional regulator [Planctomycetales bacterium]